MTIPLTFDEVHEVNVARCKRWHGEGFPEEHNAGGWTLADWSNALCGEAGELANVVKKLRRVETDAVSPLDPPESELKDMLANEAADVFCYLDLLCAAAGVDLPATIKHKFNVVSMRQNFPERIRFRDNVR